MQEVTIRLYGYLATIAKTRETILFFDVLPSTRHLVQHLGIPPTEVDCILLNNEIVNWDTIPKRGDRIAFYPHWHHIAIPHLQKPPPCYAFVVDVNLGRLAKLLRILGFDTFYDNQYRDEELIFLSQKEKRILLTRDKHLLYHGIISWGHWVMATDPYEQLKEVVDHYDLYEAFAPLTRCLICNTLLVSIDKTAIEARLPPRVKEWCEEFFTCLQCGRIYWKGSHYDHMMQWINRFKQPFVRWG